MTFYIGYINDVTNEEIEEVPISMYNAIFLLVDNVDDIERVKELKESNEFINAAFMGNEITEEQFFKHLKKSMNKLHKEMVNLCITSKLSIKDSTEIVLNNPPDSELDCYESLTRSLTKQFIDSRDEDS